MSQFGIAVILNRMLGDQESYDAYHKSVGKVISEIKLDDDVLSIVFSDSSTLKISDDEQWCCESRYIRTDDNLGDLVGCKLIDVVIKDAPSIDEEYGEHEVQFLEIKTDKNFCTLSCHNEHNGYYSGFSIVLKYKDWS